jgi:thiamine pyrophosphokinase
MRSVSVKALILATGELYGVETLRKRIRDEAFGLVIGVDGGSRYADTLDVRVDAIVGDMDSIPDAVRLDNKDASFISYPPEKDETDLELALTYAGEQGADKVVIVGAMGGRMDMTVSNILLVAHASSGSCRIEVWHGGQTGWVIRPPGEDIPGNTGDIVSLIPVGGSASGITTRGMKYPLDNEKLTMASRGVSNEVTHSPAHVGFSEGLLLVVRSPGKSSERSVNGLA